MTTASCPRCSGTMTLDTNQGKFRCDTCRYTRFETLDEAQTRIKARGTPPAPTIHFRGQVEARARALFESGTAYAWKEDVTSALAAFRGALEIQPDFIDPYVWIAKLSDDPTVKRQYLEDAIARDPGNLEALRLLMVVDGRLTQEEADRALTNETPLLVRAESAVSATTETLQCPVCGGGLTVDQGQNQVVCRFCGHHEPIAMTRPQGDGADLLTMALLERRARPKIWIVGERILHCSRCGSDRTIPEGRLSGRCLFCGSEQVLVQDAHQTIEPPDGLLPFAIDESGAQTAIRDRLRSIEERLYMTNPGNRPDRALLEAVYLPFWVFDAMVEVSQTTHDLRTPTSRDAVRFAKPYENIRFRDASYGIVVPAVTSPASDLLSGLGEWEIAAIVPYEPALLSTYPAALHDVPIDQASLEARSIISRMMRARHMPPIRDSQRDVSITAFILQMSFRLLLLPVWSGIVQERDGDRRPVVVHGQDGRVVFGKARESA